MATSRKMEPMMTTSEVARLLNIHINTVRRWSNNGALKTYRIGARGDRRFRREDILSFLSLRVREATGNGEGAYVEKSGSTKVNEVLANY